MIEYSHPVHPGGQRVARTMLAYAVTGTLEPATGASRLYNDLGVPARIIAVRASVGTPPAGAPIIIDVLMNGATSIFGSPGNRPAIQPGQHTTGRVTAITTPDWPGDAYLTVNITQVGNIDPGADLTVQVTIA